MKTCQITVAFLMVSFAACFALDAQLKLPESPDQLNAALANIFCQPKASSETPLLPSEREQPESLVEANTAFALDLFSQLKGDSGNCFFSPYSISTALAMTYAGARGKTEKQMRDVLHFANVEDVSSHFGVLQRHLRDAGEQKGVELNIANGLWAEQSHPFVPAFLSTAAGPYEANINQAEFKTGADAVRNQINGWVAQQTRGKIQNILPPGSLDIYTRLILANAIYFKGLWDTPYDKTYTSDQPFHLTPTNQLDAPLMHKTEMAGYMENSDFQAAALFYKGGLDMLVFLPRQIGGCANLEKSLTPAMISATLRELIPQEVEVFLPRFKLESNFRLNDCLARMGMPDAFGERADFSGMDGSTNLYVSEVFHRAWCEVTEEGTEAAAATGMTLSTRSAEPESPPPPPIFRGDHPFVFFIRDARSGSILFVGRLARPSE